MEIQTIPIHQISPPLQPDRLTISAESLNDLTDSMSSIGLLQPIIVRPTADNKYEIIAGHRRYQAAKQLEWLEIPCLIRDDFQAGAELGRLAENTLREDLTPIEEGLALQRIADSTEENITTLAILVRRSPTWVTQRLALIKLPTSLQEHVHTKNLAIGTALALSRINDVNHQQYLTEYALRSGASVDVIRAWVDEWLTAQAAGDTSNAQRPELPEIGAPVTVLVPCYICANPTPHTQMVIARLCRPCHKGVHDATSDADNNETATTMHEP
jgi:ParB family transcriptional regulator, chromosome partitioning protein